MRRAAVESPVTTLGGAPARGQARSGTLRRRAVALACALALEGEAAAQARAQDGSAEGAPAEPRMQVLVTGSNIPTVDRETAVPVQTITRTEIERANFETAAQLANSISANVSYGTFTQNLGFAGSANPGLAAAGLRGLSAQRTLVLVNGRRIANYAFGGTVTDLNVIPVAALERVEVLKDGASAIYGSDAIGGVINFVLRGEFRGVLATAQYSSPDETGGWSDHFNVTAGYGTLSGDGFNVYGMVDYQRFGALAARDREFSKSYYIPNAFNQTSSTSFPANVRIGSAFYSPSGDPANGFRNPTCAPPVSFPTPEGPNAQPNRCNFDPASFLDSINASERFAATGALTWQLAPDHQLFVQGLFARNSFTFVAGPTSFANIMLGPGSPWYPHALATYFGVDGNVLNTPWRSAELGGRTDEPVLTQWNAVAGLKGTLSGWRYDTAVTYGVNSIDDRYTSGYTRLLTTGSLPGMLALLQSGRVNPFGYNTPDVLADMQATQVEGTVRTGESTLLAIDGHASRTVYALPAGGLAVAIGAEARRWRQSETSSEALASGNIVGVANFQSMSASRDTWAVFAEARAPLADGLEASLALRFDSYSDVGPTTNPKVTLRWQALPSLLFRASAGTGFKAPGLEGLYAPTTTGTSQTLSDPARCPTVASACNTAFTIQGGGNPDLKPEKSSQWGAGMVWSPTPALSLGADYFDIVVDDLIYGLTGGAIFEGCPDGVSGPTCGFIVRGPPTPANPTLPGPVLYLKGQLFNAGTIRTNGVDLTGQYRFPASAWGQVKLAAQGTYIIRWSQQQPGGGYLNQVNHELNVGFGGAIPYWHHYLTIDWNLGPWAATLTENFLLGTYDAFPDPGEIKQRTVGNYDVWNLSGSYSGFKGWQVSAGIKNLFNRNPPFTNQTFTSNAGGPAGYDPTYADPIGRVFWAAVQYRF